MKPNTLLPVPKSPSPQVPKSPSPQVPKSPSPQVPQSLTTQTLNAAQQATNIPLTTKIASAVSLFRSEFPDAKVDLKPWAEDSGTQELVDPDSIDFSFHFPGWSRRWQSRSVLVQIRFYEDKLEATRNFIGLEVAGFDYRGKQWRLSTVNDWQFEGDLQPQPEIAEKLKQFCRQIFELFSAG